MIIEQSQMELDFVFLLFCGIWANNSITLSSNFFTLIKWGGCFQSDSLGIELELETSVQAKY